MNPREILALASTILTATAIAIPSHDAPKHGTILDHNEPYYLWTKYGLNTSEEYKYFQEPGNDEIHAHYDSRFFKDPVPKERRSQVLTHIVHSYFEFFNTNELETWIAHGTLLGWWWNGNIMPWDWDIDTQVSEATLTRLANDFNGTVTEYNTTDSEDHIETHSYLLDINPWSRQRDQGKGANIIDARWIDRQTGLYIDITGLSRLNTEKPNEWEDKHNHNYLINDIYPLRASFFEGVAAKIPFRFETVLIEEYGEKALTETHYNHHTWNAEQEAWEYDWQFGSKGKGKDGEKGEDEQQQDDQKEEEEEKDDRQYE